MPEDEDLRYVWAVAELERSVKESKTRKDVLQKVVGYQNDQIEGWCQSKSFQSSFCQNIGIFVINRLSVNTNMHNPTCTFTLVISVTQNYVQEKKAIYDEFQRKIKEFEAAPTQGNPNNDEDGTKTELDSLAHKTRSTRIAYREMKTFLGNLLPELNASESSTLGPFLESLWRKSIDSDNGDEACLKLSHLDYDVDPKDVALLVKFNVIEKMGADDDSFRLVQATH